MIPWKKQETQEGTGEFVTGYFCKATECTVSELLVPAMRKSSVV